MDVPLSIHSLCALFAVLYTCIHVGCLAANHHGTHGQTESATMHFYYDPEANYFVAATASNCYLVPVTLEEKDHVHTNQGIEDLELRMLHDWLGKLNETRVYHDDAALTNNVKHWCSNQDIYMLNRQLPVEPSPVSPLTG